MAETRTIGQFLSALEAKYPDVRTYLKIECYEVYPERLAALRAQPVSRESILIMRKWVTFAFETRLQGICTDAMWQRVHREYRESIEQFDDLAAEWGIVVGEPRQPISFAEVMSEIELIKIDRDGNVTLEPGTGDEEWHEM